MALADTLSTARQQRAGGRRCSIARLLDDLPDGDATALTAALADQGFRHDQIAAALRAEYPDRGDIPGSDAVGRHRRGQCSC